MEMREATWPSGTRILWRSLTWGEFNKISFDKNETPAGKALEVYKLCMLEGPPPNVISAGIVSWIGKHELEKSIFTGQFETISLPLKQARDSITNNYLYAAQALVASVFKIPFADMYLWDGPTFLRRVAQAELIAGKPLEPVNPQVQTSSQNTRKPKKELTPAQRIAIERKQELSSKNIK